jgi:hypothetical protein
MMMPIPFFQSSVADPFLTPGSGMIGWLKNQDPDPGSGSRMNIPDHNSKSVEKIFWVKNT